MSGGGKGGSTTSEVKIPQWLESAARANLARAEDVAEIGYVPYYGPDVAAMTPMQEAAIQNINQGASAFGLAAPFSPMAGMPQVQEFAGGVRGYSSAPIFEQSLAQLEQNRPGQFDAISRMFIDPMTGQMAQPQAQPMQQPMQMPVQMPSGGGGRDRSSAIVARDRSSGGGQDIFNTRQGPNMNGQAGYGVGGFTSFGDMFDGGGAGASGDTFQGGGRISEIGNIVARPSRDRSGSSGMGGGK